MKVLLILLISFIFVSCSNYETTQPTEKVLTAQKACIKGKGRWLAGVSECEYGIVGAECERMGGEFDSCASACRHSNGENVICTKQCVFVCKF